MTWQEGEDGTEVSYRERLRAPWWLWLIGLSFVAIVAVAYGYALGGGAALVAGLLLGAGVVALLATSTTVIHVDDKVLRVGRARLPLTCVGSAAALDPDAAARARTVEFDPAAFLLLRTWAAPGAIRIGVRDPLDPHPYWLVSTRHPTALVAAIEQAVDNHGIPGQALPNRAG